MRGTETRRENWNQFWKTKGGSRFTRQSWSKIRIMKLLEPRLQSEMEVLDAGCGSGFFSEYFLSRGCRVHTLDYSRDALELARRTTGGRSEAYVEENLLDPSFGERFAGRFDLIFTDGLFEHFAEWDQVAIMANFKLAKKPSGIVATFVPNRFSWWEIVRPLVMPGIHEVPFTPGKLAALHASLKKIQSGGINVLPFAVSPDRFLGRYCGMLLYYFAR